MSTEKDIEKLIIIEACKKRTTLFKNNVGSADVLNPHNGKKYRINFGLCRGSSDLIGITPVEITKEMIGSTVGLFTAVEVKKDVGKKYDKKRTEEQNNFINFVNKNGGIALKHDNHETINEAINISLKRFNSFPYNT